LAPAAVVLDQAEKHLALLDTPISGLAGKSGLGFEYVQTDVYELGIPI